MISMEATSSGCEVWIDWLLNKDSLPAMGGRQGGKKSNNEDQYTQILQGEREKRIK